MGSVGVSSVIVLLVYQVLSWWKLLWFDSRVQVVGSSMG